MIFTAGGPVMWILLAMAAVAVVTYVERLVELRRAQVGRQDFLEGVFNVLDAGNDGEALAICEDTPVPVARVVADAIRCKDGSAAAMRAAVDSRGRAEISRLDRRLAVVAIIAQVAPLVGLFGTFCGFIRTVLAMDAGALVSRAALLDGAMDALVPAAAGVALAAAASAMYGSLRVRLERTTVDLEAAADRIVGYFSARTEVASK